MVTRKMSEVLEFFLSNKNVIDALDSDYYYLVFKMAKQLEFTKAQYRELVSILIDADIYNDKAEEDRIQYLIEIFSYKISAIRNPIHFDTAIKHGLSEHDKLGFRDEAVLEIISEAFINNKFTGYELKEKNGEAWIHKK